MQRSLTVSHMSPPTSSAKETEQRTEPFAIKLRQLAESLVDIADTDPILGRIINGAATKEQYVSFLYGSYHYVLYSGPLLGETATSLRKNGKYTWLAEVFETKTEEEAPHYQWALNDLKALGEDPNVVKLSVPSDAVKEYVRWNMTKARAGSPAFLGAAYALEFLSAHRATMAAKSMSEFYKEAVSFLEIHGDADSDHITALDVILDRIHDPHDQEDILQSARNICSMYTQFFSRDL